MIESQAVIEMKIRANVASLKSRIDQAFKGQVFAAKEIGKNSRKGHPSHDDESEEATGFDFFSNQKGDKEKNQKADGLIKSGFVSVASKIIISPKRIGDFPNGVMCQGSAQSDEEKRGAGEEKNIKVFFNIFFLFVDINPDEYRQYLSEQKTENNFLIGIEAENFILVFEILVKKNMGKGEKNAADYVVKSKGE